MNQDESWDIERYVQMMYIYIFIYIKYMYISMGMCEKAGPFKG